MEGEICFCVAILTGCISFFLSPFSSRFPSLKLNLESTITNATAVTTALAALVKEGYDVHGYNATFLQLSFCLVNPGSSQFDLCSSLGSRQTTTSKNRY
jgi:hypothetical protein